MPTKKADNKQEVKKTKLNDRITKIEYSETEVVYKANVVTRKGEKLEKEFDSLAFGVPSPALAASEAEYWVELMHHDELDPQHPLVTRLKGDKEGYRVKIRVKEGELHNDFLGEDYDKLVDAKDDAVSFAELARLRPDVFEGYAEFMDKIENGGNKRTGKITREHSEPYINYMGDVDDTASGSFKATVYVLRYHLNEVVLVHKYFKVKNFENIDEAKKAARHWRYTMEELSKKRAQEQLMAMARGASRIDIMQTLEAKRKSLCEQKERLENELLLVGEGACDD